MGQSTEVHTSPNSRIVVAANNLAVPVTNALTTLLEILSLNNIHALWVSLGLTVHNFNAFAIQAKFNPAGPYVTLFNATGQFTNPAGPLLGASGDLTALAAGSTGWFGINPTGMSGIRVQASSASAAGTLVDVYAGASS